MIKRLCVLLFVLCLGFVLTACSSTEPRDEVSQTEQTEESVSRAEEVVPGHVITSRENLQFPIGEAVPFAQYFNGNAYIYPLITNDEGYNLPPMINVTFEPSARTNWHSHESGQILMVTGGVGYYQAEGKVTQILREGDIVKIEPNVKHWHGSTPESWFSHIAIMPNPDQPGTEWMEAMENEDYNNLVCEEFGGRNAVTDNDENNEFLFAKGNALNMETFNGTNYVAFLLQSDDVFDVPGMMNVIFEPGVINNWHSHEGGQVMIATDGVGFHQLRGQPVEVLYPGDVAFCPPNEEHWHGASSDGWFAHLAISSNPEKRGMEWMEPVTDEDYNKAMEAL